MQLHELIDQAAEKAGSKAELARRLAVTPQRINDWRAGYRPCPLKFQQPLTEIAGVNWVSWLTEHTARQIASKAKAATALLALIAALVAPGAGGNGVPEGLKAR